MGVDTALRFVLVVLHFVTMAGGFMVAIGLGWTTRIFDDKCVLFADMKITADKNNSVTLSTDTVWGNINHCYYCTFSTGTAAIYAIIWFWFYFLLSEWDETNTLDLSLRILRRKHMPDRAPPDSRLLFPTLFLTVVLWVCVAFSLGMITKGSNVWCQSVTDSLNQPCSYISTVAWLNVPDGEYAYTYLRIAQAGNWILLFTVLAKILVVGCRVYLFINRQESPAFSPRSSARHHSSLVTAKYVSLIDQQRAQLFQDDEEDEDEEVEGEEGCGKGGAGRGGIAARGGSGRYCDIPYADSDVDECGGGASSSRDQSHDQSGDVSRTRPPKATEKRHMLAPPPAHQHLGSSLNKVNFQSPTTAKLKGSSNIPRIQEPVDEFSVDVHETSFKYVTL